MNGIIIVNKPQGFTSQDVVSKIKKILNEKKAGHTGTLDPLATGVLPVLLGNYTKLSKYLIEHDKVYIARIKLGKKSSTGDSEGEIIEEKAVPKLSVEEIKNTLNSFLGKQTQIPPMYSAIKINGKKLYEYARNGETVEVPAREIEIYSIKLLSFENDEIEFEVASSKGTYIRTLCEDIAKSLGTARIYECFKKNFGR
jgi:tRNA pseudouridine55 synthase